MTSLPARYRGPQDDSHNDWTDKMGSGHLPIFPDRFGALVDARTFIDGFVQAYKHEHHHTGIGLHTPADVHYGHATTVTAQRSTALAAARVAHPERFATTTDPKILALPNDTWINQPAPAETTAA